MMTQMIIQLYIIYATMILNMFDTGLLVILDATVIRDTNVYTALSQNIELTRNDTPLKFLVTPKIKER